MGETTQILVASQNGVKRDATIEAFTEFSNTQIRVELSNIEIKSGVSDQPLSLEETVLGALNQFSAIKNQSGYNYYVAIEGGMYKVEINGEDHWFESACSAVASTDKEPSVAFGPAYPVPRSLISHTLNGVDLNQAMEIETGIKKIGSTIGFNGWLTNETVTRQRASAQAVLLALYGLHHE